MLDTADQLRETDRAEALALYAAHQDAIETTDEARIAWICEQVAPTPPDELRRLFERVRAEGPAHLKRAALHAMASVAWFGGRGEEAEQLWGLGLRESDGTRDRTWIRSCLNLAVAMGERQCLFEPLVLTGMGARAAKEADLPYLEAFGALTRAGMLLDLGDLPRAQACVDESPDVLDRVTDPGPRRVVEHERFWIRGRLLHARGELEEARTAREAHIAWIGEDPSTEDMIVAGLHMDRLQVLFDLEPERTQEHIAAYEAIATTYTLGPTWYRLWEHDFAQMKMRAAMRADQRDEALANATILMACIRDTQANSRKVNEAAKLGRTLIDDLNAPELAREAFDIASHACLNCIVEADRAAREIPELAEATPEDWHILREYRRRLADQQQDLLDAVTANLKPGAAAFDLIVHKDTIRVCAWCSQVRTTEEIWRPLAHFVPPSPDQMVTHGICESCRSRFAPE